MIHRPQLRATATGGLTLRAEALAVEAVDVGSRTITGTVLPYGVAGRTNLGGLAVRAGAVRFREPHRRVIGVYGHTPPPGTVPQAWPIGAAVSRMVGVEDTPEALRMQLRVARTTLGDQLLAEADPAEGVRASLSIELTDCAVDDWTGEITDGLCEFVGHVPLGAFDDAQVLAVQAAAHPHDPTGALIVPRSARPRFSREFIQVGGGGLLPAAVPAVQAPAAPAVQAPQPPAPVPSLPGPGQVLQAAVAASAATPAPQVIDEAQLAAYLQRVLGGAATQAPQAPEPAQLQAAAVPPGLPAGAAPQGQAPAAGNPGQAPRGAVRRLAQLQASLHNGTGDPAQLRAALADVTNAGLSLFQRPAGAIGAELWTGATYQRRFVRLMAPGRLTSWQFGGWRWVNRPKVDDWAGSKTPIPTNPVSVEPATGEAEPCAGGWDIDRKFRDFGDAAFWEGFYAAQVESYLELSDQRAAAHLADFAVDLSTQGNLPAGYLAADVTQDLSAIGVLRAAALGSAILEDTPNVRRPADWVTVNTRDWLRLMDLGALDLPAFLTGLGVKFEDFQRSPLVPSGTVQLGVTPAATFYELDDVPVRVEALDVARGGIDSAVYGYTGALLNRPGGIIQVPLAAADDTP